MRRTFFKQSALEVVALISLLHIGLVLKCIVTIVINQRNLNQPCKANQLRIVPPPLASLFRLISLDVVQIRVMIKSSQPNPQNPLGE